MVFGQVGVLKVSRYVLVGVGVWLRRVVNRRVWVTPWLVSSSVISSSEQVARLRQRMMPRLVFRYLWGVIVVGVLASD